MPTAALPWPIAGRPPLIGLLAALTLGAMLLAMALGAYALSPTAVISALVEPWGIGLGAHTPEQGFVLWHIRLPRVLLAALVGGALGKAIINPGKGGNCAPPMSSATRGSAATASPILAVKRGAISVKVPI